ncbi:LysR family transcriptional regulator [Limnohabitans sp.]
MKDFDLTTLRLFVAVCDAKSIKRVAEREQVDASGITKRIAKLEEQLQMPLIKRVRQGVTPTPEGAIFCEQASKLVCDAQKIAAQMTRTKSALTGTLMLAASSANVASVLTEDIAVFLQQPDHRKVQIIVNEMMSKDVVQAVRDGRATMGVIWDNTETSGLQHEDYYCDQVAVVVNQTHPLREQPEVWFVDVTPFDMVTMRHSRHTEALLKRTDAIADERMHSRLEVSTWEAGLRAAAQGVGAFICPAKLAHLYTNTWDLHVLPLADAWAHQLNKIIYPSGLVNPLAMQLVAHLSHQHPPKEKVKNNGQATVKVKTP